MKLIIYGLLPLTLFGCKIAKQINGLSVHLYRKAVAKEDICCQISSVAHVRDYSNRKGLYSDFDDKLRLTLTRHPFCCNDII